MAMNKIMAQHTKTFLSETIDIKNLQMWSMITVLENNSMSKANAQQGLTELRNVKHHINQSNHSISLNVSSSAFPKSVSS